LAPTARESFERGRRAVSALVAQLPAVAAGGRLATALVEQPSVVERALARLVPAAAFVLSARARGLLAAPAEACLARWLAPDAELGELGAGVLRAALAAVTNGAAEGEFGALEPEALGGYYEGTLGIGVALARELTVVVTPRRQAGGAAVEVALGLESLAASKARVRAQLLRQAGLELGAQATRAAERAAGTDALLAVLTRGSTVKPRVVPAGRIVLLLTDARRRSGSHYTP
jgi:hypothetical protein